MKFGLSGVVLLAVPTVGLALRSTVTVAPAGPLQTFDARQFSVLSALADTFCPGAAGLPPASALGIAESLDTWFTRMPDDVGRDLGRALDLLENALLGAVLDQRPRTFTACSPEERVAVLEAWRESRLEVRRGVYKALRGFVMAAYWGDRRTWGHVGYGGMPDYSAVPSPPSFHEWIRSP